MIEENNARDVLILGAARTPMGRFQGALSKLPATQLGAAAIKAAIDRAGLKSADEIDEVVQNAQYFLSEKEASSLVDA